MANEKNIPQYTAADIEKYHRNLLTNKERHDLEKAAMDDPFLADALEGYLFAGTEMEKDLSDLRSRLEKRINSAKLVTMIPGEKKKDHYRILKAAIVIGFIAGAGLLIYNAGNPSKKDTVAVVNGNETIKPAPGNTTSAENDTASRKVVSEPVEVKNNTILSGPVQPGKKTDEKVIAAPVVTNNNAGQPAAPVLIAPTDDNTTAQKYRDETKERADAKDDAAKMEVELAERKNAAMTKSAEPGIRSGDDMMARSKKRNVFRGRVTDAENNSVPFANVTNIEDNNTGTYTDAKGYFNLTYPDSVLTVQVKSVGFENTNVQLRGDVSSNRIVLKDDRNSLNAIVVNNQRVNSVARNRENNRTLQEPEPADGWENYDAYVANNLTVPEDLKDKRTAGGEVELSFDVDKDGEPYNIKVVKSLCAKCDQEAIRLLKQGPKWKTTNKTGRTTVTISF